MSAHAALARSAVAARRIQGRQGRPARALSQRDQRHVADARAVETHRQRAETRMGRLRAARDARAGRRRRLRARRARAPLRRRHARPAARCARSGARCAHRALHRMAGISASRSAAACGRSRNASKRRRRRHRADLAARGAPHLRQHRVVRALHRSLSRRGARCARVLHREGARDASAPREVPGHAVQPRTEREGKPRRAARPADHPLDRARGRLRQQLARARHARPHHRARGARAAPQRRVPGRCARGCT
jgi:hypothetical protein